MSNWFYVMGVSGVMFVSTYGAGLVPLLVGLNERKVRLMTIIGAGLLIGTALAVIIPEGIVMMEPVSHSHAHHSTDIADKSPADSKSMGKDFKPDAGDKSDIKNDKKDELPGDKSQNIDQVNDNKLPSRKLNQANSQPNHEGASDHGHGSSGAGHPLVGLSLVTGFVFMLLVDQMSAGHMHSHKGPGGGSVSVGRQPGESSGGAGFGSKSTTATIGLVVHAAADGIALGAAALSSQVRVEMVVFIAIMLHKAPAAFGLTSFLLHETVQRTKVKLHLLFFSGAAPLMAILTYFILAKWNIVHGGSETSNSNATGVAMLFSGGTFLYVATVHVFPELSKSTQVVRVLDEYSNISQNDKSTVTPLISTPEDLAETGAAKSAVRTIVAERPRRLGVVELILFSLGAFSPVLLGYGHSH